MMLGLGIICLRLIWTGGFGWFVQQHMRWPLIGATIVLIGFGVFELIRGSKEEHADASSARWAVGPKVGWLLMLPIMVLLSVAPTGLGAAAADRVEAFNPTQTEEEFPPLDTSAGPIDMRVFDFLDRAAWDPAMSLSGVTVRLEGLVVNDPELDGAFKLTKFMVGCCAADAIPLQVTVHGATTPLANDDWIIADVVWREPEIPYAEQQNFIVEADAIAVQVLPEAPQDPYESPR